MGFIILALVTAAVLFVLLGISGKSWRVRRRQWIAALGAVWLLVGAFAVVPTGHTGILTTFGKVEDTTLEAGLHFKLPIQEVVVMDNRTQKSVVELSCFSSDIQEVSVKYSINYQIQKTDAQNIYKTIGVNYYDVVMQPRIEVAVRSVIAKYTAETLIENRDTLSSQITEILLDELAAYNIDVVNTAIEDMDFSDIFTQAVEAKQVAQQEKLKAETEQEQKTMEEQAAADRQVIAATLNMVGVSAPEKMYLHCTLCEALDIKMASQGGPSLNVHHQSGSKTHSLHTCGLCHSPQRQGAKGFS